MDSPKPLHWFKVYPIPGERARIEVLVFRNLREMRRYGRYISIPPPHNYLGICHSFTRYTIREKGCQKRSVPHQIVCEIHLSKTRLGVGLISHECTHALFAWMRRKGYQVPFPGDARESGFASYDRPETIPPEYMASDQEERCCTALGEMMRQIMVGLNRIGLINT